MDRYELRKEHTREAIHQAFMALLQTRDYNVITVREIAEHADIGFKTFYRHYKDKDDLTEALYNDLWQNFLRQIQPATPTITDNTAIIRQLLLVSRDNAAVVRAILAIRTHTDLAPESIKEFARLQIQQFHPEVFSNDDAINQKLLDAVTVRFISGQVDLIKWWIEDDFSLSIDTMTTLILKLVVEPILSLNISAIMSQS